MNTIHLSELNLRFKIFAFFAYVFFGGSAFLFVYFKTFGGAGFDVSRIFFDVSSGIIGLSLILVAVLLSVIKVSGIIKFSRVIDFIICVVLLLFVVNQLVTWEEKYADGLFVGGSLLKELAKDDILYLALYYFITFFQVILALSVSVLFFLSGAKEERVSNLERKKDLNKTLNPLLFSQLCVFLFFHLWR